ncbi:MAG: hypothetical protein P8Y58_04960 [Novosphingobium sp.]
MKWLAGLAVLAGILLLGWRLAVPAYAEYRLRGAMVEAGVREQVAQCIAERMSRRLSTPQLLKLDALAREARMLRGLRQAAGRMDDPDIAIVASSSVVLCSTGFAR